VFNPTIKVIIRPLFIYINRIKGLALSLPSVLLPYDNCPIRYNR